MRAFRSCIWDGKSICGHGMETAMDIRYRSTRGGAEEYTASQTILKGLAPDGGLFVPDQIPRLERSFEALSQMDYRDIAYDVMSLLFTDFTEDELKECIDRAYDDKFDTEEIAKLHEAGGAWYLELYHGATIAFKDMALSILPHLMTTAAKKNGVDKEIVILTATSGDTGKAALAGFADVPGTRIMVFYPKDGVSVIQERQMVTQKGSNVSVVGIRGNFDDAQTGVKKLFTDEALGKELEEKGFILSSANSINIGRLVPQIAYYFYAYTRLVGDGVIVSGDLINIAVPTGNFGNILAAYYAKEMGLPVAKLICASNENRVLFDFFQTGTYDRNREFFVTCSPSMDILVSSNLERLIYDLTDRDPEQTAALMKELAEKGTYTITDAMKEKLADFSSGYADENRCEESIYYIYRDYHYFLDPHTAVAASVYNAYRQDTGDQTTTVIAATASPYKFTKTVLTAIGENVEGKDDFGLADMLSEISGIPVPDAVESIRNAEVLHEKVADADGMEAALREFLGA